MVKVIISGFGRSGTTWLSDIISKSLGGIVLFEPFHPCVFEKSIEFIYSCEYPEQHIKDQLLNLHYRAPTNPWIIRNHLNSPLEEHAEDFIQYIWENSDIIGFKSIRANHSLKLLRTCFPSSKLIHIYRHPFAVLSSINNRSRFWKEFGWDVHKTLFYERALVHKSLDEIFIRFILEKKALFRDVREHILLMWCISFMISLNDLSSENGMLVCYEDLYRDPYKQTKEILSFLGDENQRLHPSYFFTPSMTSLSTIHHLRKYHEGEINVSNFFWEEHIKPTDRLYLGQLMTEILSFDETTLSLARRKGYI